MVNISALAKHVGAYGKLIGVRNPAQKCLQIEAQAYKDGYKYIGGILDEKPFPNGTITQIVRESLDLFKKVVQRKDGVQITHTILNNGKTNTLTEISAPRGSILIRHMPSERVSKYKVSGFSGAKTASSDTFFSDLSPEQEKILKGYILGRNNDENTVRQIFQG